MKMTLEEMLCDLYDKYGNDFNWYMVPFTQADGVFVAELNKEIGQDHFLYGKKIWAVAKCESNDDVLYVLRNEIGRDILILSRLVDTFFSRILYPMLPLSGNHSIAVV